MHIEYVDKIVDMRRHLVQEEARFPTELTRVFKSLETQSNPWGINADKRDEWAEGLDVPRLADKPDAEYLFFVGCAGSFDDRAKKITEAVAKILDAAGVSYAILGKEETCNGETARRLGNEYLYQTMASMNVEIFNGYNVKKVITNCPHCFNTIANELPQFGGNYEVVHASQLVADLISQGRLQDFAADCARSRRTTTRATSAATTRCTMRLATSSGRFRASILKEAGRSRNKGMCCGAGGGRMWIDEDPSQRVNTLRVEQLLETKPQVIASACPFCMTMLSDGVKEHQAEDTVKTRDILEILADALAAQKQTSAAA